MGGLSSTCEVMLTIRPEPCARMTGTAAWTSSSAPRSPISSWEVMSAQPSASKDFGSMRPRRVVHEHPDAAERPLRALHELPRALGPRDVGRTASASPAGLLDRGDRAPGALLVGVEAHDHVEAVGRQARADRAADAARPAGHDRDPRGLRRLRGAAPRAARAPARGRSRAARARRAG